MVVFSPDVRSLTSDLLPHPSSLFFPPERKGRSALLRLFDGTVPIPADRHTLTLRGDPTDHHAQVVRCAHKRASLASEHVAQVERSSPSREMDDRTTRAAALAGIGPGVWPSAFPPRTGRETDGPAELTCPGESKEERLASTPPPEHAVNFA